ncbi:MAG: NUDIX domain-containing protein [Candidatus Babeliales bacterium]|nr:NUDIX domain-containing protein [Candidatus Babeliales bacterium]
MQTKQHFGVYGIILKDNNILLIKKSRGPYKGKLDLPGGRPELDETNLETLIREVIEETRVVINQAELFNNYNITLNYKIDGIEEELNHSGAVYLVTSYDDSKLVNEIHIEDSLGAQWFAITDLTETMLSPFAFYVIDEIKKSSN